MTGKSFLKFECLALAVSICFGTLALCGCQQKPEVSEESEESIEKTYETDIKSGDDWVPSPTPLPSPSPTPAPMTDSEAEKEALELAANVGLKEEDLRGKYALFLRYSHVLESNPDIVSFRHFLYRFYPVVADHLKSENEEYFFKKLITLKYVTEKTNEYAGAYSPSENIIYMQSTLKGYIGEDYYNLVVYHETMHFIDFVLNGESEDVFFRADNTFGIPTDEDWESWDEKKGIKSYDASYFVEGGAEKYKTEYFTYASTDPTPTGLEFLVGLEYILGKEKVDEFFFANDTAYAFSDYLRKNGFSNDEIHRLMTTMETDKVMKDGSKYIDPREVLIKLYKHKIGPDYAKDKKFCKIIASMNKSIINKIPTEYRSFISKQKKITDKQRKSLTSQIKKKLKTKKTVYLNQDPYTFFLDGELKMVTMAYTYKGDIPDYVSVIIDYDFEKDSIKGIQLFEAWAPKKLPGIEKLSSDNTSEGKALIKELTRDNSEAHKQTVVGTNPELAAQYKKAEELGNKYGVYIWFDDLTPDGVLFSDDAAARTPGDISYTLDKIERVLSLYPEDYFDQLLFEYYDGVAICLYIGWLEEAYSDSYYLNGKHYLTLFVNAEYVYEQIDSVCCHPGADKVYAQFKSNTSAVEAQLICDIWELTEKVIDVRNRHFKKPVWTSSNWSSKNYKGFKYLGSTDANKLANYEKKIKKKYFINNGALANAKNDRTLTYEYIMLMALSGKKPEEELSKECQAKVKEIKNIVRKEFDTTSWPGLTSWERAMIKL